MHSGGASASPELRREHAAASGDQRRYLPRGMAGFLRTAPSRPRAARALRARGDHGGGLRRASARSDRRRAWPRISIAPRLPARTGEAIEGVEIAITRYGGPEVLVPRRASIRAPGSGEVRLLQTAVGVNFIDIYCRRGTFDLVPPGGVPGMEAAGVVESVGPGVANVRAGDRVGLRLCAARRLCFHEDDARRSSRPPPGTHY